MTKHEYKYQKQINELAALGCHLPELYAPDNMSACRFVFSDTTRQNHIPQYMSNPKRMLRDMGNKRASISLLALSCFTTQSKAEAFYANLQKAFRNISKTIGDALSEGMLRNEDGKKTASADNGHFDFYEYKSCDLNITFHITKQIVSNEGNKGI